MVSLIERGKYIEQFKGNQKVHAFLGFLFPGSDASEIKIESAIDVDTTFLSIISSIVEGNQSHFEQEYNKISQRVPNSHTPFVNDDYLLFVIALGIIKFNVNIIWFESVLEMRKCVTEECIGVTRTLQNIISKNYNSLDNNFSVLTVCQPFLGASLISNENKKKCYSTIISKTFPKNDSDFLNILDLKAFDLLLEEQLLNEKSDLYVLKAKDQFLKRKISQISNFLYALLYIIWVSLIFYLYFTFPIIQSFVQSSEAIFGFLGFGGVLALLFRKNLIIQYIEKVIFKFLLG